MRITLVQPYITSKSIAKEFYNIQSFGLSEEFGKKGHQVTILTTNLIHPDVQNGAGKFNRYKEEVNGFQVVYLPTIAEPGGLPIFPTLPFELVRLKPDIIQAAEDAQLATACAVLCGKAMRVPTTVYQGMYGFTMSHVSLRKLYSKTLGQVPYKLADAFICKSSVAREFVVSLGVNRDRAHVVPVGFKKDNHNRVKGDLLRKYAGEGRDKVILSVGRLVPEKGFDTGILAMKQVVEQFPDAVYVILGSGPEQEKLTCLVEDTKLTDNVLLVTDKIRNTEMAQLYSGAYLYLIPSLYEIFNMTMLEALACGCPVIASREGGMQDVVKHGKTGYLFEKGNPEQLAQYMCDLLSDQQKWNLFSKQAQEDSCNYDWSRISEQFLLIYNNLLNKS